MNFEGKSAMVVAVRCADLAKAGDCEKRTCVECGEEVWASESTLAVERQFKKVDYLCQICMPYDEAIKLQQSNTVGIPPGGREELEREIGVWNATLILHKFGAREL